jgi:predicted RNase H-like nuclease (RuvC/YqgF family)
MKKALSEFWRTRMTPSKLKAEFEATLDENIDNSKVEKKVSVTEKKWKKIGEQLSKLREEIKNRTPKFREGRKKLHELQMQAAQANVELAQAKVDGSGDVAAKQSAYDALSKQVKEVEQEVNRLYKAIVDSRYAAQQIIKKATVPDDSVLTEADLFGKLKKVRDAVKYSSSDSASEKTESTVW